MGKEQEEKNKRCFFCHKRLVNNKGLVCKRCKLKGKDIGQKTVGGVVVVGTTILSVASALGRASDDSSDN